jgi:hypothetical protein
LGKQHWMNVGEIDKAGGHHNEAEVVLGAKSGPGALEGEQDKADAAKVGERHGGQHAQPVVHELPRPRSLQNIEKHNYKRTKTISEFHILISHQNNKND